MIVPWSLVCNKINFHFIEIFQDMRHIEEDNKNVYSIATQACRIITTGKNLVKYMQTYK